MENDLKRDDLIRRSDAVALCDFYKGDYDAEAKIRYELLNSERAVPAVDAVEVCRCGQCQFTETDCVDAIYCQRWDRWGMEPDGYCAWGQRREDGDGDG